MAPDDKQPTEPVPDPAPAAPQPQATAGKTQGIQADSVTPNPTQGVPAEPTED